MQKSKLTYKQSGVDYAKIDPLKIMAQKAARETAQNLLAAGFAEVEASRGESAYVIDLGDFYLAAITECLGTKSLVADEMRAVTGKTYYGAIAQDTIATAINDVVTVGARPLCVHAYWAVGGSDWFDDERRMSDLVAGWKRTCDAIGVSWGGGETPSLSGVVAQGAIDLAASCVGIVRPKERLTLGNDLQPGDTIVLLESSGIHANGLTLARRLAEQLENGYRTLISDGQLYGEALLDPTVIYSPVTEALFEAGVNIRYMSNITGHGWRKLMRHPGSFTYRITEIPPVPAVLRFIVEQAGLEPQEAYGSLNMGAGFAVFVPAQDAEKALEIAARNGVRAYQAGLIEEGERRVVVEPLGIVFAGKSLGLRA
jgi:phosphoribosylformylglycinamidine cyclo-ligase